MKEQILGYGKHGFALEVNPWQSKSSLEAALLFRGTIVSAWANVEASIIEVALRCSVHPNYAQIRENYPSKLKSRVSYLKAVLAHEGPLSEHSALGNAILDRYRSSEDLRNLMAHGGMQILPLGGTWRATFHMFKPKDAQQVTFLQQPYTEDELKHLALKSARFSRAVKALKARLESFLPPISELL